MNPFIKLLKLRGRTANLSPMLKPGKTTMQAFMGTTVSLIVRKYRKLSAAIASGTLAHVLWTWRFGITRQVNKRSSPRPQCNATDVYTVQVHLVRSKGQSRNQIMLGGHRNFRIIPHRELRNLTEASSGRKKKQKTRITNPQYHHGLFFYFFWWSMNNIKVVLSVTRPLVFITTVCTARFPSRISSISFFF